MHDAFNGVHNANVKNILPNQSPGINAWPFIWNETRTIEVFFLRFESSAHFIISVLIQCHLLSFQVLFDRDQVLLQMIFGPKKDYPNTSSSHIAKNRLIFNLCLLNKR